MPIFSSAVVMVTILGFIINELIGPYVIILGLAGWAIIFLSRAQSAVSGLLQQGWLMWAVPALCCVSTFWSLEPQLTFRGGVELLLTAGLAAMTVRTIPPRILAICAWVALFGVVATSVVVRHRYFDNFAGVDSTAGIFYNKNSLAYCSGLLVLCGVAVFLHEDSARFLRALALISVPLGLVMAVLARSVGALVALAVALCVLMAGVTLRNIDIRTRHSRFEILLTAGILLGGLTAFVGYFFSADLLRAVGKDPTLTGRTVLWMWASRFSVEHPWLGTGFEAFWVQGHTEAEYLWKTEHIAERSGFHFHSIFWQETIELGYIGVMTAMAFIVATLWRVAAWMRNQGSVESALFAAFVVFAIVTDSQAVDLFQVFSLLYFLTLTASGYALTWANWVPKQDLSELPMRLHAQAVASMPERV